MGLDYPKDRISLAFLVGDSDDANSLMASVALYLAAMANTAGQWHALIGCNGQHRMAGGTLLLAVMANTAGRQTNRRRSRRQLNQVSIIRLCKS